MFLLIILCNLRWGGKFLSNSGKNVLPMFVLTWRSKGGFYQIIQNIIYVYIDISVKYIYIYTKCLRSMKSSYILNYHNTVSHLNNGNYIYRWFWMTKVCLQVREIPKICLFGCLTGWATSWKANFENYSRSFLIKWDQFLSR